MGHANRLCSTQKALTVSPLVSSPLSFLCVRKSGRWLLGGQAFNQKHCTHSVKSVACDWIIEAKVMSQESLNQALCLGPTESLSEGHAWLEGRDSGVVGSEKQLLL